MNTIKMDIGNIYQKIEIVPLGDLHIGEAEYDAALLDKIIKGIKDTPNRYVVLNGDLINNAIVGSVSDNYGENLTPMEQLKMLITLFKPIKDKILGITSGNHEERTYKSTGLDIMELFAEALGIAERYGKEGNLIFLSFGKNKHRDKIRHVTTIYHTHIGGTKAGLLKMSDVVEADIYIRGHFHNVDVRKIDVFKTDKRYKNIKRETKAYIQHGACLNYGGYVNQKGYAPGSKLFPLVTLDIKAISNVEIVDISVAV